jgi:hypothetical protein
MAEGDSLPDDDPVWIPEFAVVLAALPPLAAPPVIPPAARPAPFAPEKSIESALAVNPRELSPDPPPPELPANNDDPV